ncbi:MAG: hypothetical protein IPM52_13475 [Bacteroidetes bacterium]|nr:hypothetical protein [Bacteroidota bacterium]
MKLIRLLLCAVLLASGFAARSQYFLTGQDAARTKWKQLNTTHFRLIFPEEYARHAQQTANLLEAAYPVVNAGLGARSLRTDVVLHNQNSISNALVAWAPRRMDFFHVPPQDGYSQDWNSQLVLHELRHVAQLSRLETGFGRGLRFMFGQQATGAMAGLFLPSWFLEGDAVWAETYLSRTGRGRTPTFEAGLKAQLLQKGAYSYEKAWFGSFRDFTPDIYELGYHIVAFNSLQHGQKLWENAVQHSATRPWKVYPFSAALRQQTGMGAGKLYRATMDSLKNYWASKAVVDSMTHIQLSPDRRHYTNYRYPQSTPHGIVAFRTSFDDLSRIVKIDATGEQVLFTPYYIFPEGFSARNHLVAWNEFQPDLRWTNRAYSVIKLGDIHTGKIRQLSRKSYYYAPDLNHAGDKIAVAEVRPDGSSAILIIDIQTGETRTAWSSETYFVSQPKWLADDEHIAFLCTGPRGKAIWLLNVRSQHAVQYTSFVFNDFHLSSGGDGQVFLHGTWAGRHEAMMFDFATKQLKRLTSTSFAASDPVLASGGDSLIFAAYTADGWKLAKSAYRPIESPGTDFSQPAGDSLLGFALDPERFTIDKAPIPDSLYLVRPYRKGLNLFRLHSWAPFYVDAVSELIRPGFSLMSQNSLSTMVATAGYDYDLNEGTGKSVFKLSYYGFFPEIEASLSNGRRRGKAYIENREYDLRWDETSAGVQLGLPLNFTRNRWQRGLRLGAGVNLLHRVMDKDVGLQFKQNLSTVFNYNLLAYNLDRKKMRDIFPRTGQIARIIFRHTPFDEDPGSQFFASATAYFPGLANHHGIRLYVAMHEEQAGYYNFGSYISVPRGYTGLFGRSMRAAKLDYAFPLAYPDHRVGPLIYTKRLRTNLFYDFLQSPDRQFSSSGIELWADVHLFRLQAPVSMGFRMSFLMPEGRAVSEFIFGIDWNSIY